MTNTKKNFTLNQINFSYQGSVVTQTVLGAAQLKGRLRCRCVWTIDAFGYDKPR